MKKTTDTTGYAKKRPAVLLAFVIGVQVTVIVWLGADLYAKYDVAQSVAITPVEEDTLYHPTESRFAYFYDTKPNTNAISGGGSVPEHLNDDGLRDRYDYSTNTPEDTIRIITLGDSHTYGVSVPVEFIYPEVLEDRLNESGLCGDKRFEVLNFGMHGYDALFAAERFRLKGSKYEPDILIWYVIQNDFNEHRNTMERMFAERVAAGEGLGTAVAIEVAEQARKQFEPEELEEMQLSALIETIQNFKGSTFVFSGEEYLSPKLRGQLEALSADEQDLYPFWPYVRVPFAYRLEDNGHPNREGHAFIADHVYEYLHNRTDVLCSSNATY